MGRPEGADDVAEVRWFHLRDNPQVTMLVSEHKPLYDKLLVFLGNQEKHGGNYSDI